MGLLLAITLAGCNAPAGPQQGAAGSTAPLMARKEGVPALATALVTKAQLPPPPPSGKYPVVIDPWIDVTTGDQVATTKLMQQELETLSLRRSISPSLSCCLSHREESRVSRSCCSVPSRRFPGRVPSIR